LGERGAHCIETFCGELCKTAEPIKMPFGLWNPVGPRKHVLDGAQIPHAKGQLLGERTYLTTLFRELCKMAEPVDLLFRLWTRVV